MFLDNANDRDHIRWGGGPNKPWGKSADPTKTFRSGEMGVGMIRRQKLQLVHVLGSLPRCGVYRTWEAGLKAAPGVPATDHGSRRKKKSAQVLVFGYYEKGKGEEEKSNTHDSFRPG